jgi:hypothetical protein
VPVAQDALWEVWGREHQAFHGLGQNPVAFPEIETTYDDEAAKREAARCYRCDAETGSSDYSVRSREDIFVMARTTPADGRKQKALFTRRLTAPHRAFHPEVATLDDLVFLPANLSRLVIDPYRDACKVETRVGDLVLATPFLVGGFDDAPEEVRRAVAHGVRAQRLASAGRRPLAHDVPWLQLTVQGEDEADESAHAVVGAFRDGFRPEVPPTARPGQRRGLAVSAADLREAIPFALAQELDLLLLEGSPGLATGAWPELPGAPDLTVMRDAIRILRELNREEDIGLLYFGGVRSGTDGAKLLGLGADAIVVSLSLALAVGGAIEAGGVGFYGNVEQDARDESAELFLNALRAEASIMPRCTGKTDIHNIEPEDLRSISVVTGEATGIPLAGFNSRLAVQAQDQSLASD